MIHHAVGHIVRQLNTYLKGQFDLPEDVAVLSGLVEQDGAVDPRIYNKLVFTLVNVEKEAFSSPCVREMPSLGGRVTVRSAPLHLAVLLLVSANFPGTNYEEALKFISHAALFFQGNPVFTRENAPDLPPGIERLTLEIENLEIRDLSSLWSILSGKYLPSIQYRMRLVTLDPQMIRKEVEPAVRPETGIGGILSG